MNLVQWEKQGKIFTSCGLTAEKLPAGVYVVRTSPSGIYFEAKELKTDDLLRFEDPTHETIIGEIDNFWSLKDKFSKLGFLHNRSILMHGPPGSGKSCISKIVVADVKDRDNIIINCDDLYPLSQALTELREVEPERQILVLMEDIDSISGQHKLLPLLDGEDSVDNILYLCTTNYINKIPERLLRPGRIDRRILVDCPPRTGRVAFLRNKLGPNSPEIDGLADATQGLSFAHLRELLIGIYCLGHEPQKVLDRLHNKGVEILTPQDEIELDEKLRYSLREEPIKEARASVMSFLGNKRKVTASTTFKLTAAEKRAILKRRAQMSTSSKDKEIEGLIKNAVKKRIAWTNKDGSAMSPTKTGTCRVKMFIHIVDNTIRLQPTNLNMVRKAIDNGGYFVRTVRGRPVAVIEINP